MGKTAGTTEPADARVSEGRMIRPLGAQSFVLIRRMPERHLATERTPPVEHIRLSALQRIRLAIGLRLAQCGFRLCGNAGLRALRWKDL